MTKYDLMNKYGYRGVHPIYGEELWRHTIANDNDERRGYWTWVAHKINEAKRKS